MKTEKGMLENGSLRYDIDFVKNGKSGYTVVIPAGAGECTRFAAEELCTFVRKCTGAELCVKEDSETVASPFFSIGNTVQYAAQDYLFDYGKLNNDGFIIKTDEDDIYLNAFIERGLLYGVYDFLEKFLGVRFIAQDTTVLPKTDSVAIPPLNIMEIPDFRMRGYLEYYTYMETADQDFAQRMRMQHTFLTPDAKHGGRNACWGRNNCHNFHYYVKPSVYDNPEDKEHYHPEFFWHDCEEYGEECSVTVCLTNGITEDGKVDKTMDVSVAKVFIEELKKDIIANPDIVYFNIDQEDGPIRCKCPKCMEAEKKYMRSGMLIRFCNAIAEELNAWAEKELNGRKIYLNTLAYSYAAEPPVKIENGVAVPLDPTVVAGEHLLIKLCFGRNCLYSVFDKRQYESTRNMMKYWRAVAKRFFGWSYDGFFDRYFLFMPSIHNLKEDFVGYKNFGIEYHMVCDLYNSDGLWQVKLKLYICSKLMWNTAADENALYEEFLTHYFGETGKTYVKRFVNEHYKYYFEKLKTQHLDFWIFGLKDKSVFDKQFLLDMRGLVNEARAASSAAEKDEEKRKLYDRHIAELELAPLFPLVEHYKHYFPENTEEQYIEFAKEFVEKCNYVNAKKYHEHRWLQFFVDRNYQFDY